MIDWDTFDSDAWLRAREQRGSNSFSDPFYAPADDSDDVGTQLDYAFSAIDGQEDVEACERCGEGDGPHDDVVAVFWDETGQRNVLAHAQCGEDAGWRLA